MTQSHCHGLKKYKGTNEYDGNIGMVWKELWYGKAETLEDAEDAVR